MKPQLTREEAISEITRRLVEAGNPVRVYLFGSAARGEAGPDSDLDFLVVVGDDAPAGVLRGHCFYRALRGIAWAVDVIPWRLSDFEGRAANVIASLPATVKREGKLLYDGGELAA